MTELNLYVQYQTAEGVWSNWTLTTITCNDDGTILSPDILLDLHEGCISILRVMTPEAVNLREINADNAYWLLIKENRLYEVKYNPRTKEVLFAKPIVGQRVDIAPLLAEAQTSEEAQPVFGKSSYDELQGSSSSFFEAQLKAQEFVRWLQDIISGGDYIRAPDPVITEQLIGGGAQSGRDGFAQRLVKSYHAWVLRSLEDILSASYDETGNISSASHDDFTNKLEEFLVNVWSRFGRTVVGPTALPKHPVTQLLIGIAEKLKEHNGSERAAIDYLMPGIATGSESDLYQDLTEIPLDLVLRTHILDEVGPYLWPISFLILKDKIYGFNPYFCKNADRITTESTSLRLAMHSELTQAFTQTSADVKAFHDSKGTLLSRLWHLRAILKRSDAHGGVGSADSAGRETYPACVEFFEFYKEHILPCDLQELQAEPTVDDMPNPGEMRYIYTEIHGELKLYFLNSHVGVGTLEEINLEKCRKEEKGEGTSARIQELREALSSEGKAIGEKLEKIKKLTPHDYMRAPSHVPERTKEEIALLYYYSHDCQINYGHGFMDSCTGKRGGAIEEAYKAEESRLVKIGINEGVSKRQREDLEEKASGARSTLQLALNVHEEGEEAKGEENPSEYSGSDQLFITKELLEVLNQRLVFNSPADIAMINLLSGRDIHTIFGGDEALQAALLNQIDTLENFVCFLTDIPSPLQVQALFEVMGGGICSKYIEEPYERYLIPSNLGALLSFLTPDKTKAVCDGLGDHLSVIIQSAYDLNTALRNLSDEQRTIVFDRIESRLSDFIGNDDDLRLVISLSVQYLNKEQKTVVFGGIGILHRLPDLIRNFYELQWMLEHVLEHLNEEQKPVVFGGILHRLPELIMHIDGFKWALEHLGEENKDSLFLHIKDKLPHLIVNIDDFKWALEHLGEEHKDSLFLHIKYKLPHLFAGLATFDDVRFVLEHLGETKKDDLFGSILKQLPILIRDINDFSWVSEHLSQEQKSLLVGYFYFKSFLKNQVTTADNLARVLEHMNATQTDHILGLLKGELGKIITNVYDFQSVLPSLKDVAQRAFLLSHMMTYHYKSNSDFTAVADLKGRYCKYALKSLDETKIIAMLRTLQNVSPTFISTFYEATSVLIPLEYEQKDVVFNFMLDKLSTLNLTASGFIKILRVLDDTQRAMLFACLKHRLPEIITIRSSDISEELLTLLPDEQKNIFHKIQSLIEYAHELRNWGVDHEPVMALRTAMIKHDGNAVGEIIQNILSLDQYGCPKLIIPPRIFSARKNRHYFTMIKGIIEKLRDDPFWSESFSPITDQDHREIEPDELESKDGGEQGRAFKME